MCDGVPVYSGQGKTVPVYVRTYHKLYHLMVMMCVSSSTQIHGNRLAIQQSMAMLEQQCWKDRNAKYPCKSKSRQCKSVPAIISNNNNNYYYIYCILYIYSYIILAVNVLLLLLLLLSIIKKQLFI